MNSKQRTRELLAHALAVASQAGVSPGLVSARLGTMAELRRAVMRAAVAAGTLRVVAEGLAMGDKHAMRAPVELRAAALSSLMGVR